MENDIFVLLVQSSLKFERTGKKLEDYASYLCRCEVIAEDELYHCSFFTLFRLIF